MSVIGEFTVPPDDFALHHALTTAPDMVVEIERVVGWHYRMRTDTSGRSFDATLLRHCSHFSRTQRSEQC